ncbi:unnamed protein product, partial [Cyprideis torosa]
MLKRTLTARQWTALVVLMVGVATVQLANTSPSSDNKTPSDISLIPPQNKLLGFTAAVCACLLSGFAGVYFEKILKGSDITLWMRQVQLAIMSIPLAVISCYTSDYSSVTTNGFFHGYDAFVWFLVAQQSCGGLLVALVVKYADNILKG